MPDTETFFPKLTNINFTVRNMSPNRRIRVFNYPINPGQTRDLLAIPEISEADIRHSLIKGELANLIRMRVIYIVSSSIDLLQFDTSQSTFLANAGVPLSTLTITPSSTTGTAGGDLAGNYPNPTLIPVGSAGTYGDPSHYPVITTDTKGRVISVYSQALSSFSGASASGDLTGSYPGPTLIAVGTAGTYGDATHYPVITTDSKGRVISVSTQVVSGGGGGSFTAAGDLSGSSTSQTVAQISSATGNINWAQTTSNPQIGQTQRTTDAPANNLTINAQNAYTSASTDVYGGQLLLQAGNASDGTPGASIVLSGASPRSTGHSSDMGFLADQYTFSTVSTTGNTFILDSINAAFYPNGISPSPTLGKPGKYWSTVYTNSVFTNQITNPIAPTAGQFLLQNATANGIVWSSLSGDVSASTSTPGQLAVNGVGGYSVSASPAVANYPSTLVYPGSGSSLQWDGPVLGELQCTSGVGGGATLTLNQSQWTLINLWSFGLSNGVTANSTDGYMHFTNSGWYQSTLDVSFIAPATSQLQFAQIKNGVVEVVSSSLADVFATWGQSHISHLEICTAGDVVGIVVQLLNNPLGGGTIPFQMMYGRFGETLVR